jgi:hypothetical protein
MVFLLKGRKMMNKWGLFDDVVSKESHAFKYKSLLRREKKG